MTNPIEAGMYGVSQWFLYPVLIAIAILFAYAFLALGSFLWQAWQRFGARRSGSLAGHELLQAHRDAPQLVQDELEAIAMKRLEFARIATRVAPMLGLVATMIPMGPALKALADGQLADVSRSLMVAFSAVILALIAAAITYTVVHVRRRWYAVELLAIARGREAAAQVEPDAAAALNAGVRA